MYHVFTDGSSFSNPGLAGIGFVIYDDSNKVIYSYSEGIGVATNNSAEYQAVYSALLWCIDHNITEATFHSDSMLVVNQINGLWKINDADLKRYKNEIDKLILKMKDFKLVYVPREHNIVADNLAREGARKNKEFVKK
ncbi:MAG: ribonuclease HI family protein [Nanopusillaceae archaeon]